MRSKEQAKRVSLTLQNLFLLKSEKVCGVRFEGLETVRRELDCWLDASLSVDDGRAMLFQRTDDHDI